MCLMKILVEYIHVLANETEIAYKVGKFDINQRFDNIKALQVVCTGLQILKGFYMEYRP